MIWKQPPEKISLREKTVDIWLIPLLADPDLLPQCRSLLSADEKTRASRFLKEEHRQRFILGRGRLRQILSHYLGAQPAELRFQYSSHGKPSLAGLGDSKRLRFNLSHSKHLAVAAVVRESRIGIDVEYMRSNVDFLKLASRFFAKNEAAALRRATADHKKEMFFRIWTRKEAYIKAHGMGLSLPLDQFEVSTGPEEPPELLQTHYEPGDRNRWSLTEIETWVGYKCALACEGPARPLRFWEIP
ncbi:MAG: 4'-phosphopantetheinyl transferase superfamily protein [Chloroflexi bacterium]|nr:4'-phosphopantetheinyl transferase superfamily protein [Chloroflexota bacterium]